MRACPIPPACLLYRLLLAGAAVLVTVGCRGAGPQKRALLIAIGDYPTEQTGWPDLHAANDMRLMRETLRRQAFDDRHILAIADRHATRAGIAAAFDQLIAAAAPGDLVVVHYSGHGQQLADDNGDEPDQLDEALVPYDAPSRVAPGEYGGHRHIRDDELGNWIRLLERKIGPQGHLLLLLDSCHSGEAWRGENRVRGGFPALVPPGFAPPVAPARSGSGFEDVPGLPTRSTPPPAGQPVPGNFVMITGARDTQENRETTDEAGNQIGSLTYAFSRAFEQLAAGASYADLFHAVRNIMAARVPYQNPTLAGDQRLRIFNGAFIAQAGYFSLADWSRLGQRLVTVTGGYLAGILQNARLHFVAGGSTRGAGHPLATGTVVQAGPFAALVQLDSGRVLPKPDAVRALLAEPAFGDLRIAVRLGPFREPALGDSLAAHLGQKPVIRLVDRAGDLSIEQRNDTLYLHTLADGQVFGAIPAQAPDAVERCLDRLIDYLHFRLIRGLELHSPGYRAVVSMIPVRLTEDYRVRDTLRVTHAGGYPAFGTDEQALLTIRNEGSRAFYFTLIDLEPGGAMNVILPNPDHAPQSLYLPPGGVFSIPVTRISPPYGTEMYKLLLTAQPADLRPALRSRGRDADRSGGPNPFGQLFRQTFRGEAPAAPSPGQVATASYTFLITPPDQ